MTPDAFVSPCTRVTDHKDTGPMAIVASGFQSMPLRKASVLGKLRRKH